MNVAFTVIAFVSSLKMSGLMWYTINYVPNPLILKYIALQIKMLSITLTSQAAKHVDF